MTKLTDGIKRWSKDAAQRALRAGVATFTSITLGGSLFGIGMAVDSSLLERAAMAGLGSAVSVVLSLAAKWANDPATASF